MSAKLISEFKKFISNEYVGLDVSEEVEGEDTIRFTITGGTLLNYDGIRRDLKSRNGWSRKRGYLTTKAEPTGYLPHNKQLFIVMCSMGIEQPDYDSSNENPLSDDTPKPRVLPPLKQKQEDSSDDDLDWTQSMPSVKTTLISICILIAFLAIVGRAFGSSNTKRDDSVDLAKANPPIDIIKMKQDDILFGDSPPQKRDVGLKQQPKERVFKIVDYMWGSEADLIPVPTPSETEEERRRRS